MTNNFSSEWKTVRGNRIYLTVRDGFPDSHHWKAIEILCEKISWHLDQSTVVSAFVDDRYGNTVCLNVVTTCPQEMEYLKDVEEEIGNFHFLINAKLVEASKHTLSDSYNHVNYLHSKGEL